MNRFVFSNLATSIDGKIATSSREFFPLGTDEDRREMLRLRAQCDVVIMGASTIRAYQKFCGAAAGSPKHPANLIISSALEGFSPEWPFFKNADRKRILAVSAKASASVLKAYESTSEIVVLKEGRSTAEQVVEICEKRGLMRMLVEGGGGVMWDFAEKNLIDEYHVTLTPKVVGGTEAPTLVDGKGFNPSQVLSLKLKECRQIEDELYLVYSR